MSVLTVHTNNGLGWEDCIQPWKNMVLSMHKKYPDWANRNDTYKLIDVELKKYNGHLDVVAPGVKQIIFDSDRHITLFLLKWS